MSEETATRQDTIEDFVRRSRRPHAVGIRQSFLQPGRGRRMGAFILSDFVRRGDHLALDLFLLLLLRGRGTRAGGHFIDVRAGTWARALGLEGPSAKQLISRALARLEKRKLVRRTKIRTGVRVELRREDGTGVAYTPPSGGQTDRYFQLPLAYWLSGHYLSLNMPGKAMLLIALGEKDWFELEVARVPGYYKISPETALRGYHELIRAGFIISDQRPLKDPTHPDGRRVAKVWHLLDPYQRRVPADKTAARIRRVK